MATTTQQQLRPGAVIAPEPHWPKWGAVSLTGKVEWFTGPKAETNARRFAEAVANAHAGKGKEDA